MVEKYIGSTAGSLDHYFGNNVGIARLWHIDPSDGQRDFGKQQRDFIVGLEAAIGKNLPEYAGVTNQYLREVVQLAQSGDWRDVETVKRLYSRVYQIRHKQFDEQKLFRTEQ